jgi:electron transfer flavoprotein alpha subunit
VSSTIFDFDVELGSGGIKIVDHKSQGDGIPLPEAELVVSAGRGLKGPENWGIVENLAETLGATTACSRPVSDIGWRPHHEHVGQTGIAIRPNLYIAAGISGAIQHLAGVNGSKVIVVINTDSEAPFFKAADYGIVGDAFEVLPRLSEAINKFKASQN